MNESGPFFTTRRLANVSEQDQDFILSLSPRLAGVADLPWYTSGDILTFQHRYTSGLFQNQSPDRLLVVAEGHDGTGLGVVEAAERPDEVTGEPIAHLGLLAVTSGAEGKGVAKALLREVEAWARERGYRLLNLAVFATNSRGRAFYEAAGFADDTLTMTKPL